MLIRREDKDHRLEPIPLVLPLPAATVRWLAMLSGGNDEVAGRIIADMLEEIRADDEAAHAVKH